MDWLGAVRVASDGLAWLGWNVRTRSWGDEECGELRGLTREGCPPQADRWAVVRGSASVRMLQELVWCSSPPGWWEP